ncbi:MAG: hypothetical protein AAGG51_17930 [Cyanobacteria bacterium P01_G01_bin.54]
MQLKRWESPRRQGRNHKGKGGAARQRQLKKQHKLWCKKLKQQAKANQTKANPKEGKTQGSSFFSCSASSK